MNKKTVSRLFSLVILLMVFCLPIEPENKLACCIEHETRLAFSSDSFTIINQATNIRIIDLNEIIVFEDFEVKNNQNNTVNDMQFWINQSIDHVEVEDNLGNLEWNVIIPESSKNLLYVEFRSALEAGQVTSFRVIYSLYIDIKEIDQGKSSYYSFEYESTNTYFTETYELTMRLPKNSHIHIEDPLCIYPNTTQPIIPGDVVHVTWILEDVLPTANQFFMVRFDKPWRESAALWVYIVSPILGVTLGAITVFWLMRRRQKIAIEKIGKIFLSRDQKLLLKLIADNDGKISQKELIELTNFTKSKISRNLLPLEDFGLIEKEKWGREFKVYLTETGKKMIK
ncbi:MAG: helix-turn-helix transcriptional regulator [Candidatus Heimdallarchaeaceae archaeon]